MYPQILRLSLIIFAAFQSTTAANASDWRRRSIYQVMTDRFARSDGSVTFPCNTNDRLYCGGLWRGIIDKLDYISGMGFTAIWISPIVEQIGGNTAEGEAYHGYWPKNIYALNPKFGTEQDLKDLIAAVHSLDMYIMVDLVVNHFANQDETVKYSEFVPFNHLRYFHPKCDIDWGNQTSMEVCWMGNGYVSLVDTNTENETVITIWEAYVSFLVQGYGIDGPRLDASRNIRKPFWTKLCLAAKVYCQGEVWVQDPEIICPNKEYMDGLHNYPFKELATLAFTSSTGNISELVRVARQMQSRCKDVTLFGTFMENHDNPRLGSFMTDLARLKNLAELTFADGIPIVYYGQEQALTGSNDPANREALWLTRYAINSNLVLTFTSLNRFRNYVVKTSETFVTTLSAYTLLSASVMSVRKGNAVLILTNSGSGVRTAMVVDGFAAGVYVVEILSCSEAHTGPTGQLAVVLRGEPMVLYPKSLLAGSRICGL